MKWRLVTRFLPAPQPPARAAALAANWVRRELIAQMRQLTRRADALERMLRALVRAHRPVLLAEVGCGALAAATWSARTPGAQRRRPLKPSPQRRGRYSPCRCG
jgi:hypothetical protein